MPLYEFENRRPQIAASAFVHPQAVLMGDVIIGENCYIAACVVLRGDHGTIIIGNGSNVQDGAVIHAERESTMKIGENCVIAHNATLHGPSIVRDQVTIGMGAVVSAGCEIGEGSILATGAILPPNKIIPPRKVAMGNPAGVVKGVTDKILAYNQMAVEVYQDLARRNRQHLKLIE